MVRALRVLDILVIVILVLIAAALVYIFWPLIIALIIMTIGYFIYRWDMKRKRLGRQLREKGTINNVHCIFVNR